jgi:hypothetical protein
VLNEIRSTPNGIARTRISEQRELRFRVQTQHVSLDTVEALPGTVIYPLTKLRSIPSQYSDFYSPESREYQAELIAEIVSIESPIHLNVIARRMTNAWGMARTGARIIEVVGEAVKKAQRANGVTKKGDFLWSNKMLPVDFTSLPVRVPNHGVDDTFRDVEHVAPEEVQRTMLLIVEHAFVIRNEALFQETAHVLGFQRTGDRIRETLIKNLRSLLRVDLVHQNGDLITLKPTT